MEKNQSRHILVIDDSPDQQFLLRMLLEARGYDVECTSNGEEALSLLRARKEKPQAILLDLDMPVMDGNTFRHHQSADPLLKDIEVIIMSGGSDLSQIRNNTNSYVLKKPFNISSLMSALEAKMKNH